MKKASPSLNSLVLPLSSFAISGNSSYLWSELAKRIEVALYFLRAVSPSFPLRLRVFGTLLARQSLNFMKTYSLKAEIDCPSLEHFLILRFMNSFFYERNRALVSICFHFSNELLQLEKN